MSPTRLMTCELNGRCENFQLFAEVCIYGKIYEHTDKQTDRHTDTSSLLPIYVWLIQACSNKSGSSYINFAHLEPLAVQPPPPPKTIG